MNENTQLANNDLSVKSKTKKPIYKKWWFWAIAAALIITLVVVFSTSKKDKLEWPKSGLATIIPEPEAKKGEIVINDDESFLAEIVSFSQEEYNEYLDECKKAGFTVDSDNSAGYIAYNSDGYKIDLFYSEYGKELKIEVEAPMAFSEITWPEMGAGALLPKPKSNLGKITSDSEDTFIAYISSTSKTDFEAYIKVCQKAGFSINYDKGDNYYYANNKDEYSLSLKYEGNSIMFVKVEAKIDFEQTETTTEKQTTQKETTTKKQTQTSKVTPSFKQAMDSYEAFIDEYVEFMKKYEKSDSSASMMTEHLDYMTKYNEFAKKIDAIDEDKLSDADALYYAEVNTRVAKKLLEVSQ